MASSIALIASGSVDVLINGLPASRMLSGVTPHKVGKTVHNSIICSGSTNVLINGLPATKMLDFATCGGLVCSGSTNVLINGLPASRLTDLVVL